VAPPLNLVLVNSKSNDNFSDSHRRLIAKIAPVCFAYNFHLILVNFKIDDSPLNFAKEIAPSTSIGESGERLVELAKKGMVQITNLPITGKIGKTIICTYMPDKKKNINIEKIAEMSKNEKLALVFGCDENRNKNIRKLLDFAKYHLDISGKEIKLEIDSEIGAVANNIHELRKV
jgi:hypothetical protein